MVFCSARPSTTRAFQKIFHRTPAHPTPAKLVGTLLNTKYQIPTARASGGYSYYEFSSCLRNIYVVFGRFYTLEGVESGLSATKQRLTGWRTWDFGVRLSEFGFWYSAERQHHSKALGERVCDEKIAGRRALSMVDCYKTRFARVFGDFLQRIPRARSMPTNQERTKPQANPPSWIEEAPKLANHQKTTSNRQQSL